MLTKITLENFFSFAEPTTIELNPGVNVLVGINGSGKSNFLKAIRLLYEGVAGQGFERIFLKEWGGFGAVANYNGKNKDYIKLTYEFDKEVINRIINDPKLDRHQNLVYELFIHYSGATGYFLEEKFFNKGFENELMNVRNGEGEVRLSYVGENEYKNSKYKNKKLTDLKANESVLNQLSTFINQKKFISKIAVYNYFDTTPTSIIRQPANYGIDKRLAFDGENLTGILLQLKNHNALAYEKIEEYLRKINPNFKDISFDFLGARIFLVLREKHLNKAISIEHISDGTLRYLLLLSILFNPERGNLVCIDEPEIGLHPDMIHSITEAMRFAVKDGTQFFIATHSPLFLNAFELDEVLIFEKDEHNQSKATIKTEEDFDEWSDDFLMGQLWLRGQLGGKRW